MELGDFEQANEFEFDLSDVAAFESVATEDAQEQQIINQQQQEQQQLQQDKQHQEQSAQEQIQLQQQQQHQLVEQQHQEHHQIQQLQQQDNQHQQNQDLLDQQHNQQNQQLELLQPPQQDQLHHHIQQPLHNQTLLQHHQQPQSQPQQIQIQPHQLQQIHQQQQQYVTNSGTPVGKIILVPIKTGQQGVKPFYLKIMNASCERTIPFSDNLPTPTPTPAYNNHSRNVSYNESIRAPTPNLSNPNEVPKRKPCNCTKSQCLKLYCDCFANGEFCSGCNCTNCFNSLSKEKERQKAISQCLERNPEAFRPKIGKAVKSAIGEPAPESIERRHTKGCNCKRSGCLKNYCECYEAKILCSNLCKCCGCKNYDESFERKSLMQLTNSATDNSRGILRVLLPTNRNSHHFNTGKDLSIRKRFIDDKLIRASLTSLLQTAQQAEKDGISEGETQNLLQLEIGKFFRTIVDSATCNN